MIMVSETICVSVLTTLHEGKFIINESGERHEGLPERTLYQRLLPRYELVQIDNAIKWLEIGDYLVRNGWGLAPLYALSLSEKGREAAGRGSVSDEDRKLLHQVDPYAVFIAYQFNNDDIELYALCELMYFNLKDTA